MTDSGPPGDSVQSEQIAGYVEGISTDRRSMWGWLDHAVSTSPATVANSSLDTLSLVLGSERSDVAATVGVKAVRFKLELPFAVSSEAIITGVLRLLVGRRELRFSRSVLSKESARLSNLVSPSPDAQGSNAGLTSGFGMPGMLRSLDDIAWIPVPRGTKSSMGDAAVGAQGHLFLLRGSNDLARRYDHPRTRAASRAIEREVSAWTELFDGREHAARSIGVEFRQVIFPEKPSVVPSGLLEFGAGPTPSYRRIDAEMSAGRNYVGVIDALLRAQDRASTFQRLDTHFSPYGCAIVFAEMLQSLGLVGPALEFDGVDEYFGNLAERFFGRAMPDVLPAPSGEWVDGSAASLVLVESFDPEPNAGRTYGGTRRRWSNPDAMHDISVMVFGSSSFGRSVASSSRLSWWFARAFRSYRFIWASEIDWSMVAEVQPDVVIGQTVERFLGRVPLS